MTSEKPHRTFIVDATMLSTFRACEEKYRLRMVELWTSKGNNGAIGSGLAYHEAGATFRKMRKDGFNPQDSYNGGLYKLRECYPKFMPIEFINGPIPDERRSLPNLERIFEAWCRYELIQNFTYHYIEQSGGISLGSIETSTEIIDIVYSVIIDAVVEQQGCLFVDDIKTTTMNIGQAFKDSFKLSQQLMGYCVAGQELMGREVFGAMVSLVWFQKQGGKTAKPVEDYFHTIPLTFQPDQLAEWHDNTLLSVKKIFDCEATNLWQKDFGESCKAYNGCTYKNICGSIPKSRETLLQLDFQKATWTPLEEVRSRIVEIDV